jgi:hypothetical protein
MNFNIFPEQNNTLVRDTNQVLVEHRKLLLSFKVRSEAEERSEYRLYIYLFIYLYIYI